MQVHNSTIVLPTGVETRADLLYSDKEAFSLTASVLVKVEPCAVMLNSLKNRFAKYDCSLRQDKYKGAGCVVTAMGGIRVSS